MLEISSGLLIGFEKTGPFPSTKETPRPRASESLGCLKK